VAAGTGKHAVGEISAEPEVRPRPGENHGGGATGAKTAKVVDALLKVI